MRDNIINPLLFLLTSFFTLVGQDLNAQNLNFEVNGKKYVYDSSVANMEIIAEHRLNELVITIKFPSEFKKGRFNSIQLASVGIELGQYPIGKDALSKIKPNEDPDNLGTGVVSMSWFNSSGERLTIASDMGYMESCSGSISILSWTEDRVGGIFDVVLNGNRLSGTFENVRVKGLH